MSGECAIVHGIYQCDKPGVVLTMCCGLLCQSHFEHHEFCPFGFHVVRKPEVHDIGGAFIHAH